MFAVFAENLPLLVACLFSTILLPLAAGVSWRCAMSAALSFSQPSERKAAARDRYLHAGAHGAVANQARLVFSGALRSV